MEQKSNSGIQYANIVIQSASFWREGSCVCLAITAMRVRQSYFIYILTNSSRRSLYTGVTNNLYNRHDQHVDADESTFVGRYSVTRLVYFEPFKYVGNAIAREKEIKGWSRRKKEALIRSANPEWRDLTESWGKQFSPDRAPDPSRQKKALWMTRIASLSNNSSMDRGSGEPGK